MSDTTTPPPLISGLFGEGGPGALGLLDLAGNVYLQGKQAEAQEDAFKLQLKAQVAEERAKEAERVRDALDAQRAAGLSAGAQGASASTRRMLIIGGSLLAVALVAVVALKR